jgi:hypothetical protein
VTTHPYEDPFGRSARTDGTQTKSLFTYEACTDLLGRTHRGQGLLLALGEQRAPSAWRIVQTELLANGCVLVTLKALTPYGRLPDLDMSKIDGPYRSAAAQAMDRVLESAYRESPISVIDHCRNALAVLLSRWLVQRGEDSAKLAHDLGLEATLTHEPLFWMDQAGERQRMVCVLQGVILISVHRVPV